MPPRSAAVEGLQRLEGRIDDPYLEAAAQLALSWILPIDDDFDGALRAASTALDGFRQQNEPFMAFAALTVGMVEMALGRDEDARTHLTEVNELGGQFDNNWLESTARTQLASIAVRAGHLDEARALAGRVGEGRGCDRAEHPHASPSRSSLSPDSPSRKEMRHARRRPSVPPMGCGGVRVCERGRQRGEPSRSWSPASRWRSIPRRSRRPSPPARSSVIAKQSRSSAVDWVASLVPLDSSQPTLWGP